MEEQLIDQSVLANDIADKLKYEFTDDFLVKALDPIMVKKEVTKMPDKEAKVDENGVNAVDYDKVETEIKEMESEFRKGVVLKVPYSYTKAMNDTEHNYAIANIKIGDVILFRYRNSAEFDLLKNSRLVKSYSIVGIETK